MRGPVGRARKEARKPGSGPDLEPPPTSPDPPFVTFPDKRSVSLAPALSLLSASLSSSAIRYCVIVRNNCNSYCIYH